MSLTELKREISTLSFEARAELAAFLCELDDSPLSTEWQVEIKRRLHEFQSGAVKAIPHEEVMRDLRSRYR